MHGDAAAMSKASWALLVLAAAPLAARASTFDVEVDPRIELLGVVQRLAGRGGAGADEAYTRELDGAFGRFKDHPAVKLYARILNKSPGVDPLGIDLLYYSAPPALALDVFVAAGTVGPARLVPVRLSSMELPR